MANDTMICGQPAALQVARYETVAAALEALPKRHEVAVAAVADPMAQRLWAAARQADAMAALLAVDGGVVSCLARRSGGTRRARCRLARSGNGG